MKRLLLRVPVLATLPESSPLECGRLFIFLIVLSVMFSGASATGQSQAQAPTETLTRTLMDLQHQYQTASAAGQPPLALQMRSVAAQRQHVLSSLIQTNPRQALQFAIPAEVSAHMPASVQTLVEQHVQIQGELQVVFEDRTSTAVLHHFLKTAAGKVELKFSEHTPTNLLTGSTVQVEGVQVGNTVALACCTSPSTTSSLQTLSPALANTFGAQTTLVMLVNFQDLATQPYTLSFAQDVVFNQTSAWDMENSLQQTWLTGDVTGWYTLPVSSTTCDYNSIATYANQAATAAGVNLSNYSRYVYAFPNTTACGWWGLGTIGGSPSQAWINGTFALKVVSHEMGHNFGLYHSHAWSCGGTTLGTNCSSIEYGDSIDTMGSPDSGHFDAFQKERLGWLNYGSSPPITLVQTNGTYSLGPYENQDTTSKALKIYQSTNATTGANTWYYIEFRQATGFDNFLSNDANVLGGVLVHMGTDNDGNSGELLDMAPSLNNFYYSALDVGQTFIDPNAGVTMQTVSANSTGASVNITFGTPTCSHFNPSVSISPYQSQTMQAGGTASYTVTVANNDNAGCSASTFNMAASAPSGWTTGFSSATLSLSPGTSGSTTVQVTSPSSATSGIYSFSTTATNSAATTFSGSASATYVLNTTPCINANPTVTLSPNQSQSVQPGTTVTYVIAVTNNDNTSCSSSVFHLSDVVPSGWTGVLGLSTASLTVAPTKTGSTSLNVTSPTNAVAGSYSFTGSATNTTYTSSNYSGTAAASYVIAGATCTRANPTVNMSPSQSQSVAAGTPVAFTVSVTDNDSSGCSSSNFNLAASLLSGWGGTWSASSLALSPGGSNSATFTVISPSTASGGTYTVTTTATNGSATSYFGSASANYVVSSTSGTSLSVATNSSSYLPGQTVGITVTVTSGGTPVSGASVSVSVINPNGSSSSLSGTTGSNGVASMSYTLKKQAQAGTYQAQAGLSSGGGGPKPHGASTATVSTSFVVQ